jgi:hypothetical protein
MLCRTLFLVRGMSDAQDVSADGSARVSWDIHTDTFGVHLASHRYVIPIVNPTRCTSVSNWFILEWHSTCFGRSFRPSSGVQHCVYTNTHLSNQILLSASKQRAVSVWLLYIQSWTADDGRKDRPKHVQCHSKINKFDTLMHLVRFAIEIIETYFCSYYVHSI